MFQPSSGVLSLGRDDLSRWDRFLKLRSVEHLDPDAGDDTAPRGGGAVFSRHGAGRRVGDAWVTVGIAGGNGRLRNDAGGARVRLYPLLHHRLQRQ